MPYRKLIAATILLAAAQAAGAPCPDYLKSRFRLLHSQETIIICEAHAGKALLIVNTASYDGFTPQFEGLEALHQEYADLGIGLAVIGFTSNDFNQEDKDEAKTAALAASYGVSFTMVAPSRVRGADANPVFAELARQTGVPPKWNFYKYLVRPDGSVAEAFSSRVKPNDAELRDAIEEVLCGSCQETRGAVQRGADRQ